MLCQPVNSIFQDLPPDPCEESIRVAMLFVSGWAASFTATFALGENHALRLVGCSCYDIHIKRFVVQVWAGRLWSSPSPLFSRSQQYNSFELQRLATLRQWKLLACISAGVLFLQYHLRHSKAA